MTTNKFDSHNVFADDSAHVRVVLALAKRGHDSRMIAKATGLQEAEVKKILETRKKK